MVRKAIYVGIPYAIGLLVSYCLYGTSYVYWAILVSLTVFSLLMFVFKLGFKQSILCETSFIVGFIVFSNYMVTHVDSLKVYEGQTVDFKGKVVQIDEYTDTSSYVLDGYIDRRHVKLSWYTTTLDCSYGDEVALTATVGAISSDYLFDSQQYYASQGVYLRVDTTTNVEVTHVDDDVMYNAVRWLRSYRDTVKSTFKRNMSKRGASLLIAILFGDKSDLSKSDKDSLLRSGLGSLIAVSGFHLAVLNATFTMLFNLLEKRGFPLPRVVKFMVHEAFMVLFVTMVDFPISAVRTLIMLSISNVSTLVFRKPDTLNTICVTSIFMLSIEPYLVGNVSFLLSIVGVYGIGVLAPYLTKGLKVPKVCKGILGVAITTACTIPICVCFFDEVSILAPITNVVCVPLCEVALVGGFLVFVLGGKTFFLTKAILLLVDLACRAMVAFCGVFSKVPYGNLPTAYEFLPYAMAIAVVVSIVSYGTFKRVRPLVVTMVASALMVVVSLHVVSSIDGDRVRVATMGNSQYRVLVVTYHGDVNVVDLSKQYKTSKYVQKYLKQYGYGRVSTITFLKRAYQSMVVYDSLLGDYTVGSVYVPQGTYLGDGYTVLGVSPTQVDFSDSKLVYYYDGYTITVYTDGSFEILHDGHTEVFSTQEANTLLEYYDDGNCIVKELK